MKNRSQKKSKQKFSLVSILFISLCMFSTQKVFCQVHNWKNETTEQKTKRMQWWTNDRFGMFIHFGIYSSAARHEWIKSYETISDADYQKYFDNFDPDMYNPKEWAAKAKEAGMKYVILPTKHHDGFCMWDSKYTDFKSTKTPYGKDLLKDCVDAFRAEGIRVGLYYSLLDWHHPDFPYDRLHPNRPANRAEMEKENQKRDLRKYQQYVKNQLTELFTNYGQIDELWLDFSYPGENGKGSNEWDSEGIMELVRQYQPQALVIDRLDLDNFDWGFDFVSPEQFMPGEWPVRNGKQVAWETCQTFSGSWGYHRDEYSWKTVRQLVAMLIETVSKGGNLLLNVGPTGRGVFDDRANDRLEGIGKWMKFHNKSIYGCTQAPEGFQTPQNCMLTYNPKTNRLYIHILQWPFKSLVLPNYKGKIKYAQLLNDNSEVQFKIYDQGNVHSHLSESTGLDDIILTLPVVQPDVEIPVIEIVLN